MRTPVSICAPAAPPRLSGMVIFMAAEKSARFKDYMMRAVLVMCDVRNPDSTPHATNTRAKLVELLTPDVCG